MTEKKACLRESILSLQEQWLHDNLWDDHNHVNFNNKSDCGRKEMFSKKQNNGNARNLETRSKSFERVVIPHIPKGWHWVILNLHTDKILIPYLKFS